MKERGLLGRENICKDSEKTGSQVKSFKMGKPYKSYLCFTLGYYENQIKHKLAFHSPSFLPFEEQNSGALGRFSDKCLSGKGFQAL